MKCPGPNTPTGLVLAALEARAQSGCASEELAALLGGSISRVRGAVSSLRHEFGVDILNVRGHYSLNPPEPAEAPQTGYHEALLAVLRATRRLHLRDLQRLSGQSACDLVEAIQVLRQRDGIPLELTPRGEVVLHERLRAEPSEVLALLRLRGPLPSRTAAALLHVSPAVLGKLVEELQVRGRPIQLRDDSLSIAA